MRVPASLIRMLIRICCSIGLVLQQMGTLARQAGPFAAAQERESRQVSGSCINYGKQCSSKGFVP
jgi:hypothetical protein